MADLMISSPALVVQGKQRSLAVEVAPPRSRGVGFRVACCHSSGRDGLVGFRRRKPWMSDTPTVWGNQLPPTPFLDCQRSTLRLPKRTRAYANREYVSVGPTVVGFSDPELHSVLELASDTELLDLSNILYGRSFLSPLLKSFTPGDGSSEDHDDQPLKTHAERDALMIRLEARFLYLAADAKATLSGRRPSYRNVLLQVRKKLQIQCSANLSTEDMECEIFLHLLQQYSRGAGGGRKPTATPQTTAQKLLKSPSEGGKKHRWRVGLPTFMTLRGKELLSAVLKGGGVVTVSTLQRMVFKKLSGKLLVETTRYQLAKEAVVKTGQVAAMLETRVAVLAARQGLIGAAKRYVTLRSAMTILGPMLWGTLLAEMLISSVGTDYARVVRAIYAFAQIRLVRAYSWDNTSQVL